VAVTGNSQTMKGFKKYSEYKASGVEWLGDVPKEWDIKRLKTVLSRNDGGVPPCKQTRERLSRRGCELPAALRHIWVVGS